MKKVVITDVSVLFDLHKLQVLPEFFALNLEIYTTDYVYNEIINSDQKAEFEVFERSKKLIILKTSPTEMDHIKTMKLNRSNKSFSDLSILWKAIQIKCTLLTCDGKLRKEALEQGLEVNGSIWVLTQLVEENIISIKKGIGLLEEMKTINARLPFVEIDELIRQFEQMI
jgi:predicted nucleic acid-binding protein